MPLNQKRVHAIFMPAADCLDPVARAAILNQECPADQELRGRVEGLPEGSRRVQEVPSMIR
jgi:hypothetical protein